jgi:hypothetical protein
MMAPQDAFGDSNKQSAVNQSNNVNVEETVDPKLSLAWDDWNKRITGEILKRFVRERHAFDDKVLKTLLTYDVTNDGKIINIKVAAPSYSPEFDAMCVLVIRSLDGDTALLEFPHGAKTLTREKSAFLYTLKYRPPSRY